MEINFKNGKNLNITYLMISKSEIQNLNSILIKQFENNKEDKKNKEDYNDI